jgi:threonine synthase
MMHGARVLQIRGNFDAGMQLVREIGETEPVTIVNSINPYRLQGQKTAAFEIVDALGRAPDFHCLPVGNAGNISAHWMGYTEYHADGISATRPRMAGYQASGAAPFLRGAPVAEPETVATAIRIGNPQSWDKARAAQSDSGGWFDECTDDEILAAQKLLAEQEGVFCEPASAISIAGALRDIRSGRIPAGSTVVCTLTGHGLKDPDTAIAQSDAPVLVDARLDAVREVFLRDMSGDAAA